jgi:hypothetical protein
MANQYSQYTYDSDLSLKAAGLVASSADGAILDLGDGLFDGFIVVDVSAIEVASGDEIYTVSIEGSTVAAMTSQSVCLAKKVFGNVVVPMDDAVSAAGRYAIPFRNEDGGEVQRYIRLSTVVQGTIATGINFSAFVASRA